MASSTLKVFFTFFSVITPVIFGQGLAPETCLASQNYMEIEPDADVVIGAVLEVHGPGHGVFGCGQSSKEGVEVFEALRWAVSTLNQNSGFLNQKSITDSFIPGVKIGLQVYDSCGHKELAVKHMTELFPVMKSGPFTCGSVETNASLIIGMVDMSSSTKNLRVVEAMTNYIIPVIPLNQAATVPPDHLARVMAEVAHDMDWEKLAILYADDEYSIFVTKVIGQVSVSGYPCIAAIQSFPNNVDKDTGSQMQTYRKIVISLTSKLADNTGVLVIGQGKSVEVLLEVLNEMPETLSRLQWLFSWIPPVSIALFGNNINSKNIFSLAPYPSQISQLEEYWARLHDLGSVKNENDHWFLEYVMSHKGCRVHGFNSAAYSNLVLCENLAIREAPLDVLLRTARFLPALHSVFTFAHAFRKAWADKCLEVPGICSELRHMTRRNYVGEYLEPLEFEHNPQLRSPSEIKGQKTSQSGRGEIGGMRLALNVYSFSQSQGVNFKQVLAYDAQEAKVLDETFHYQPSTCPKGGCNDCVSVRTSRLEDTDNAIAPSEDFITLAKSEDIMIPILLPIHQSGHNPLDCGSVINYQAVQDLEAALWAIDKINADPDFLPGVHLGAVAIDTCSSPLKLTQKLSSLLKEIGDKGTLDISSALAFIISGTSEEYLAASSLISPLNITIISSTDAIRLSNMKDKSLQVAVPFETKADAVAEMLKYLGWTFVSVIYDYNSESKIVYEAFKKLAQENGVCMAATMQITSLEDTDVDHIITKVIIAKERGARILILWTNDITTTVFLSAFKRALVAGIIKRGELVLILNGEWVYEYNLFKEFENETSGAIIFQTEQGEIQDFAAYFQRLNPETNKRNPWFQDLWHQKMQCREHECETVNSPGPSLIYHSSPSTITMVQAVLAVGAGIARLRNEICHTELGLCPTLQQELNLRELVHQYIKETASSRLDQKDKMFTFSKNGYGTVPINIFNFRRGPGNIFTYKKVGTYLNHLTNLVSMVTYNDEGSELMLDKVPSECILNCSHCSKRTMDFIVLDSPDNLYLAATIGIHSSTSNPLVCGSLLPSTGLQPLEALFWALDQINGSPHLLPGVTVGAVVFDTCNSRERAARDVSNFLGNSLAPLSTDHKLPGLQEVAGFILTQADDVVQPIIDITMPLKIPTIASEITSTVFNDMSQYGSLLRLSLPNNVLAESLVDLLKHFRWNFVSVLYSDEEWKDSNLFETFQGEADRRNIQFALVEKVPFHCTNSTMNAVVSRLKAKQEEGARAVVLLLNSNHMLSFLSAAKKFQDMGRIAIGDFVWITVDNVQSFHHYPEVSLGSLMIKSTSATIPAFRQYFENLNLKNNTRNPWLREYWEQVFDCRGVACYSELHTNLAKVPFMQDALVPNIINSVLSLSVGLEEVRKKLCPPYSHGICQEMKYDPQMKEMLLNFTKISSFMGADGKQFKYTEENYSNNSLEIFNFRQVGSNAQAFIAVGRYVLNEGLSMNSTKVKGYDKQGQEISIYDIQSQCNDTNACGKSISQSQTPVMQLVPKQEFVVGAMMPLHHKGKTFFTCGDLTDEHMFQNLAAVTYAVNKVNSNSTLLPEVELGALVFDYCGRKQKAEEQLYNYLSKNNQENTGSMKIPPRSVIATITFGEDVAKELSPMLEAAGIAQIATPARQTVSQQLIDIPHTVPPTLTQIQVLLSIVNHFDWKYVYLVYSNTDFGRSGHYHFAKGAKDRGICIADAVLIDPSSPITNIADTLQNYLTESRVKVVIVLVDDAKLNQKIIEGAKLSLLLNHFVWIGSEGWGDHLEIANDIQGDSIDAFTVKMESYDIPDFKNYFYSLTPGKHDPIPDSWFEEFWQHHFQCQLSNSPVSQRQYPNVCSGQERLDNTKLTQDKYVYHTVQTVEAVAKGLDNYLKSHCPHGEAAMSIDDCGENSRKGLQREIQMVLMGTESDCGECGPMGAMFGYQIYQLKNSSDGTYSYSQVGSWKDGLVSFDESNIQFISGTTPKSICREDCSKCIHQFGNFESELLLQEPVYANFKTVWGIVVTALSVLGIVLVIICALYFLMSFPVTVGTTVLGYMILFGLLVLYAVNFAFIVSPTESTCGIRRFGLGLAYAIIFSGMLVKVMNTWRLMGYNGSRILNDGTRLSSPAGLLVIAVGLVIIQIILSAAWLILMPPKTGAYEKVWRCAPPTTFEEGLVISLVYVMLLLAITTLFALLTWQCQDNNRESRWILACSTLIGVVWLAWTVLSTQLSPHHRDITIAAANMVSATIIMLCLYLRKVYLYSKLTRQARDQDMKAHLQPSAYPHSLYGSVQKPGAFTTLSPVLYGSQASLNAKKLYNGPSSRLELINCPDDNKSDSSGSVQVQGTDLYPLDMYDGGSQFQPVTSLYGSNHTLVLDDTLTYGR